MVVSTSHKDVLKIRPLLGAKDQFRTSSGLVWTGSKLVSVKTSPEPVLN